jgi:hypothetical protein
MVALLDELMVICLVYSKVECLVEMMVVKMAKMTVVL